MFAGSGNHRVGSIAAYTLSQGGHSATIHTLRRLISNKGWGETQMRDTGVSGQQDEGEHQCRVVPAGAKKITEANVAGGAVHGTHLLVAIRGATGAARADKAGCERRLQRPHTGRFPHTRLYWSP